jgi:hypothetical protein
VLFAPLAGSAIFTCAPVSSRLRSGGCGLCRFALQPHCAAARIQHLHESCHQHFRAVIGFDARNILQVIERTQNVGALPRGQSHTPILSDHVMIGFISGLNRVSDAKTSDIVQRRQRYLERQREMRPETVNVPFQGATPE